MKKADNTTILLKALDLELRAILLKDLQQYRLKQLAKQIQLVSVNKAA